ncbi:hypothetical protein VTL71DRAFT_15714 [Oculimacula yallundae]|uniref:Uncharacterized protein n=1 Tax=Oculimacula yallundae TaxID=86028 RepID=A0ABR4CCC9_9HELO
MACRLESLVHPGSMWPADSNPSSTLARYGLPTRIPRPPWLDMACRLESLVHPGSIWPADSNPSSTLARYGLPTRIRPNPMPQSKAN